MHFISNMLAHVFISVPRNLYRLLCKLIKKYLLLSFIVGVLFIHTLMLPGKDVSMVNHYNVNLSYLNISYF